MISTGRATLIECETVLSIEDVHILLEIAAVDAFNQSVANKQAMEE